MFTCYVYARVHAYTKGLYLDSGPGKIFSPSPRSPYAGGGVCGGTGVCGTLRGMSDLPNVAPVPNRLSESDMVTVLSDLPEGWYRSGDLLPRFNAWLAQQGRPATTSSLVGRAMSRVMALDSRSGKGHAREFHVTKRALTFRDWFAESS